MKTKVDASHSTQRDPLQILRDLVSDEFECAICLDTCTDTNVNPQCGHRFCKPCIKRSLTSCKRECPICRTRIPTCRTLRQDPQFDRILSKVLETIAVLKANITENEKIVKKVDVFSGVEVDTLEWDFLSMTAGIFKKRFKESIEKPLQLLLNDFNRNTRVAMHSMLQASILGLISGLTNYYKFMFTSAQQTKMNVRENYGSFTSRQVCFIYFQSVSKIRKSCLAIIDEDRTAPFIISRRSMEEMEATFTGPAFAPQLSTLRRAQPGLTFPLLVCWKITELAPTCCPDTFLEPEIIDCISEPGLSDIPSSISNEPKTDDVQSKNKAYSNAGLDDKNLLFVSALMAKPDLHRYINETCATCESSGIEKLQKCSRCGVARYCGREHQVEHWSIHKKHCKRLKAFAILKSDAELCPYLGKVCALCKDPDGGDDKNLEKCTRCNVAYYCGKDHQVEHWSVHKKHCKRLCDLNKFLSL